MFKLISNPALYCSYSQND